MAESMMKRVGLEVISMGLLYLFWSAAHLMCLMVYQRYCVGEIGFYSLFTTGIKTNSYVCTGLMEAASKSQLMLQNTISVFVMWATPRILGIDKMITNIGVSKPRIVGEKSQEKLE